MVDPELLARLRRAREHSKLLLSQVCELLRKSRASFQPDEPALSRKLRGKTPMSFVECQELAHVLGFELRWSLRKERLAS